jgi:4'-phosphopantetheinyl transferase
VHLWFADLDREKPGRFLPSLSPEELNRARGYHIQRDRDRFIMRRGMLRHLLAGYVEADPAKLRFCEGKNGKPALAAAGGEPLRFSLSCSGNAVLFAFARGRELGVDLERVRCFPQMEEIVARFFSPAEQKAFCQFDQDDRCRAFFQYWTAKEAFVKATGEGLSRPLDTFEIEPASEACSPVREPEVPVPKWFLRTFVPSAGYVAALVSNNAGICIRLLTCPVQQAASIPSSCLPAQGAGSL